MFFPHKILNSSGTKVNYANSFVLEIGYNQYKCPLAGKKHNWEWPEGAKRPWWTDGDDVFGCELVLSPDDKWAIFHDEWPFIWSVFY
jgi:hypothetical protein